MENGKWKGKGKDIAATAKDNKEDKSKPDKEEEAWMVMVMDEMAEESISHLAEEDEYTNFREQRFCPTKPF